LVLFGGKRQIANKQFYFHMCSFSFSSGVYLPGKIKAAIPIIGLAAVSDKPKY
jgi:hypothetical protein